MMCNTFTKTAAVLLCGLLLLLPVLLCGCGEPALLPTGGYDYRMSSEGGAILGYPIPRKGTNPYCYSLPPTDAAPAAFVFDADKMEYAPLPTANIDLPLPGQTLSVPCAVTEDGCTFFASADDTVTVYQGDLDGKAVVLRDGTLYLSDSTAAHTIADHVRAVWDIDPNSCRILFSGDDGGLYEYCGDGEEAGICLLSGEMTVTDAWYVCGADLHTVVFREQPSTPDGIATWYYTEDSGAPIPACPPETALDSAHTVHVRGTACVLTGDDDSAYFYDIRSGGILDMDMGGLYRFPQNTDTAALTVSPDGRFVYFYDIDFIYRLNLESGNLDLAYNEAPVFEGSCILSSMTPVTDEIVLLSQAANEYTEYVPTMTCAVFDEDIPEVRHEDDKIDLDYHPWQTDH
ncbi:MAG: hypothetical protein E7604_10760 [Ruminococcaceae bacterium]|nr:hypothetical protein [Oscillospiraceae bacterium]